MNPCSGDGPTGAHSDTESVGAGGPAKLGDQLLNGGCGPSLPVES